MMATIGDFISVRKTDFQMNLDFGIRYPSYVKWAGFYVPGFPEDGICDDPALKDEIQTFTLTRIESEKDISRLFSLCTMESIADNVARTYVSINNALMKGLDTPESLVSILTKTVEKYKDSIEIIPFLGLGGGQAENYSAQAVASAFSLLGSGVFRGIDIYGDDPLHSAALEKIAKSAKQHGLKLKFHGSEKNRSGGGLLRLGPDEVTGDGDYLRAHTDFFTARNIPVNFIPRHAKKNPGKCAEDLRALLDAGITVRLCTDNILLHNCSISEFATELCNTGVFTRNELVSLIAEN